jgi:hypothetical protein
MSVLNENGRKRYIFQTSNLDSIYFSALAGYKISNSPTAISNYGKEWLKPVPVSPITVKMKEMLFPYLGYLPEVDLSEFVSIDWKKRYVENCIEAETQLFQNREQAKATENLLNYYESLAVQAKHETNNVRKLASSRK